IETQPVELHLHRQPSSHTVMARVDDKRAKTKDMYVFSGQDQNYGYQIQDSSSTLYTDLSRPVELKYAADNRRTASMSDQQ
ncbi:unnamed protein product, partial [Rotaria magnacalcarata]